VWVKVLFLATVTTYVVYRVGLSVAAVRADRAGDTERAQALRRQAFHLLLGTISVLVGAGCVLAVVSMASR
jgi:Ca2+/Na+ antiporter